MLFVQTHYTLATEEAERIRPNWSRSCGKVIQYIEIQGQLILQQVLYNNLLLMFVVVYQNNSL